MGGPTKTAYGSRAVRYAVGRLSSPSPQRYAFAMIPKGQHQEPDHQYRRVSVPVRNLRPFHVLADHQSGQDHEQPRDVSPIAPKRSSTSAIISRPPQAQRGATYTSRDRAPPLARTAGRNCLPAWPSIIFWRSSRIPTARPSVSKRCRQAWLGAIRTSGTCSRENSRTR